MFKLSHHLARVVTLIGLAAVIAMSVGSGCKFFAASVESCARANPNTAVNVAGTFRYSGTGTNQDTGFEFLLSGTVTFEQTDNMVRVSDSTYDFPGNRPVSGEFTELQGNRVVMQLTPINGDTDFRADVTFVFTDGGDRFSVAFSDTNGDAGELGSFVGRRR